MDVEAIVARIWPGEEARVAVWRMRPGEGKIVAPRLRRVLTAKA